MSKSKCFLILPRSVFPCVGGYAMTHRRLIEILDRHYRLSLIVLSDHAATNEENAFYKEHSADFCFFYFPRWRYYFNALISLFGSRPLQVGYYSFDRVRCAVACMAADCEIAVGGLIRAMDYLDWAPKRSVLVFNMVDSIGLNYQRSRTEVKSVFWKLIYNIETKRLLRYEHDWVRKADVSYLVNNDEKNYWERYGRNVRLVPHGVKPDLFEYDECDPRYTGKVAFIGKMDYQPNVDAVEWYVRKVHSRIGDKIPLIIIGAFPPKKLLRLVGQYDNIEVTGFVQDPYRILKSVLAVVAPMQTGGGIQNKVLEGMAIGQINVVSGLAARPILGAVDGEHLLIADTAEQYVRTLTELRENRERFAFIGEKARSFIRSHYTWEAFEDVYVEGIEQARKSKQLNAE